MPMVDYHQHLVSPSAARLFDNLRREGNRVPEARSAERLIADLDAAHIQRAVVLSTAYWFASPRIQREAGADEHADVSAENDWTAHEAERFPGRLTVFFSVNPLREWAVDEVERCAKDGRFKGLKLHFANSGVDMLNSRHIEQLHRVFEAANTHRLAIVVHLWSGPSYGQEQARAFLTQLLPAAPDIVVQIAHFAGGGPGYTESALEVFADAIRMGNSAAKNLYFDVSTVAEGLYSPGSRETFARRIRQVGLSRVLYGTDSGSPAERWATFRSAVPLTDEEFRTIAGNVAPYLR
jgi:predicted TIM-barrel fold metal-dependent hydrolase